MPKFDLDSIFNNITSFLTFDIRSFFSFERKRKFRGFLPCCWDGQQCKDIQEQIANEGNVSKEQREVTAKIKREERKRKFLLRTEGPSSSNCGKIKKAKKNVYLNKPLRKYCVPRLPHQKQPHCINQCREDTTESKNVECSHYYYQKKRQKEEQSEERTKNDEEEIASAESLLKFIQKCIRQEQSKMLQNICKRIDNNRTNCCESAQEEQLKRKLYSNFLECKKTKLPSNEKENFFEYLQDLYAKLNVRLQGPVEKLKYGIQVDPLKRSKQVGTDSQCKKSAEIFIKNLKRKKPKLLRGHDECLQKPRNRLDSDISEVIRKCMEEERLKRLLCSAPNAIPNKCNKRRKRGREVYTDERQPPAKRVKLLYEAGCEENLVHTMSACSTSNEDADLFVSYKVTSKPNIQCSQSNTPNFCVSSQMIAILHNRLSKVDINDKNEIEKRAEQVWQCFQQNQNTPQSEYKEWNCLLPYQKLAFCWAVIANQSIFESPLDNFLQFYLHECSESGKKHLTSDMVEAGTTIWDSMDRRERLPFIMEAFIFKVSMGKVDMNNEFEIRRMLNEL